MDLRVDGRVAVVTGGGTGLGLGFARALAEAGAAVAVTGRRAAPLDAFVAQIEADGGRALAVICDVRDRAQVDAAVRRTVEWGGAVDILVNNAGVYPPGPFLGLEESVWLDVMDTNLNGAFRFSQECGKVMAERGWGRIINVISPSAVLGFGYIAAYGTSKAAMASMTRCIAAEVGPLGITVNALLPGIAATETFVGQYTEAAAEILGKRLPLGRAAEEDDLTGALLLLASDAGRYITGETIAVDGGMTNVMAQ